MVLWKKYSKQNYQFICDRYVGQLVSAKPFLFSETKESPELLFSLTRKQYNNIMYDLGESKQLTIQKHFEVVHMNTFIINKHLNESAA